VTASGIFARIVELIPALAGTACCAALALSTTGVSASDEADVTICHGYGCRYQVQFPLTDDQLSELQAILKSAGTAEEERSKLAQAVSKFYEYAAQVAPIADDRGRNYPNDPAGPGRMDCIDHSTSVSSFLRFLGTHRLLQFHQPMSRAYRSFLVVFAAHWSAQVLDLGTGTAFVVDRWPYDHGREPLIMETEKWRRRLPSVGEAYAAH
jgi:hypothetical protein